MDLISLYLVLLFFNYFQDYIILRNNFIIFNHVPLNLFTPLVTL